MTELLKIISIALITIFANLIIKQTKPEFSLLITIVGSLLIIILTINTLSSVVKYFYTIIEKTGVDVNLMLPLVKIVAIGYIAEFGANICVDAGASSIADKILFAGKLVILTMSLPIITNVINLVVELL